MLLFFRPEGIDRVHHKARLHRGHRPEPTVDAFNLAGHQSVSHVIRANPAVFLGDGDTQQAGLAHQAENLGVRGLVHIHIVDPGLQLCRSKGGGCIADHALVFFQLILKKEGIAPVKGGHGIRRGFWRGLRVHWAGLLLSFGFHPSTPLVKSAHPGYFRKIPPRRAIMGIDSESDVTANLQIGPTSLGMVRIFVEGNGIEVPMDFEPEEAEEIAEEIKAAAGRARAMATKGGKSPKKR